MIRDKAPTALRGQINRMDSLHSQPSSWCTIEPHRKPGKEKITTPKVMNLPGHSIMIQCVEHRTLLGEVEKGKVVAAVSYSMDPPLKWWSQAQRTLLNKSTIDKWDPKKGRLFHFT